MKTKAILMFVAVAAVGSAEESMDSLRQTYFREVSQWNAANAQLVQTPLFQAMQKLSAQVAATREKMAKLCKSGQELKDVPISTDPVEGTQPVCVVKGAAPKK